MLRNLGATEILVIVLLIFFLFGLSKFPDMMKNLARGIKTFKEEMKEEPQADKSSAGAKPAAKKSVVSKTAKPVKKPTGKK